VSAPVRVVVGEDDVLMREGIVRLLAEAGFDVVAHAGDADALLRKALGHQPDVVVTDVQMPPGHGDDGLRAALEVRRQRPAIGVLVLSQYYEEDYALDLIGDRPEGVGYLLKERVGDVAAFVDAVARVAAGGSALDPEVVGRMLGRRRADGPLDRLSPRERDVLASDRRRQVEPGHRQGARRHRGRGREARDEHLPQARARPDADRAQTRSRDPDLPARLRELAGEGSTAPD
jgi:DNA-binding NarL/FixJ family response regulator